MPPTHLMAQPTKSPSFEKSTTAEPPAQPLTIEYMDLLKTHGHPDALAVREFLGQHGDDHVFQARALVLNRVFLIDQLRPQQAEASVPEEASVTATAGRP